MNASVMLFALWIGTGVHAAQQETRAAEESPPAVRTPDVSPAEAMVGWRSLSGTDAAAQWRGYRAGTFPGEGWEVTDAGVLRLSPGGGDLVTVDVFDHFELVFEWRTGRGGNSGIMYRVQEDGSAPWQTGLEYQLLDDEGHAAPPTADWSAGALYGLAGPRPGKRLLPAGMFNHGRIVVQNGRVEHWVNNRLVVEIPDLDDEAFRAKVARSKFAEFENFAMVKRGRIAIQDHGDAYEFRQMRMRTLPWSSPRGGSAVRPVQPPVEVLGSMTGMLMRVEEQPPTLLFIGDDVMAGWRTEGREQWDRSLALAGAVNLAVEGELPAHTLFKLDYPQFLVGGPRAAVVRFGNVESRLPDVDAETIALSIAEIVAVIRTRSPGTVVFLHVPAPLPRDHPHHEVRSAMRGILSTLGDGVTVRVLVEDEPLRSRASVYAQWIRSLSRMLAEYGFDLNLSPGDMRRE